ncbi:caspase family protein [Streptomyces sp. DSM 44917]|uniref:Caspase family protein n=1 Tax=Streptomyces boetiae TaxID=3075541 RepID=A0ABU2LGK7_9ACTN|nr:caspase family protein [Streptomyces sp. DSM 44917]MDT0310590.1 caspase family protein [Streptomyces sp. DSM 44917]
MTTGSPVSPGRSAAVLIGVSSYAHLADLPAVRANVADLAVQLRDASVWGLPGQRCHLALEPRSAAEAIGHLRRAVDSTTDTLLVYYAGHGLIDPDRGDLWLGLPGSIAGEPDTTLPWDWIRRQLLRSRAECRIVVLDCCYSGRALGMMAEARAALANGAAVEGTYLMASAAESAQALAPPGETHTAFTGELIGLLRRGVPEGPELLALDDVFALLADGLRARSRPEPQRRVRNDAGRLPLFRNRAWAPAGGGRRMLAGRYELHAPRRRGALSDSFAGTDTVLGREVIVRLMRPEAAAEPALRRRFEARTRSRAPLGHPSIALLLDLGSDRGEGIARPFHVVEAPGGRPLHTLVAQRPLPPAEVVRLASGLLGTLEHAHGLGAAGWDLVPENLTHTPERGIRLLELAEGPGPVGPDPDAGADLRAVGGLMYRLLTGRPLTGDGRPTGPSTHRPEVSEAFDAVVLRALAADPAARYAGAAEMRQAVDSLAGQELRPAPSPPRAPAAPPRVRRPSPPPPPLVLRFAAGSHTGLVRKYNADSGYAGPRLLAVADGYAAPVASAEVISVLSRLDATPPAGDPAEALGRAAALADTRVKALGHPLRAVSSSATALLWNGAGLGLMHIGRTRAYLLRAGMLYLCTRDHTWAQGETDEWGPAEEEPAGHGPPELPLFRELGLGGVSATPDLALRQAQAGDRYLLCSDGLSGPVSPQLLHDALTAHPASPQDAVNALTEYALRSGGPDNITCVVADVAEPTPESAGDQSPPYVVGAVAASPPFDAADPPA